MGSFYRNTNLTTRNNNAIVGVGLPVVSDVEGQKYNFPAGDFIVYDPTTNLTLDAAGIATAERVRIAVGHNPLGGVMTTELRHLGHGDIDLLDTRMVVKGRDSQIALPHVIDVEFDCLTTGEDYGFTIEIDDWLRRSYFKEGAYGSLVYNLRTDTTSCDSCSEEANCEKIACQLAAKIRGDYIKAFTGSSKLALNSDKPNHGIWAHQKFTNEITINLADGPVQGDSATAVIGLKSIDTAELAPLILVGNVSPYEATETLVEQLPGIIDQMNAWLNGVGSVYLKTIDVAGAINYQLVVNTCNTVVTLTYHNDLTDTGASAASFAQFTPDSECENCGSVTPVTLTCGVRIFVDPLELPCNCAYPGGNPPSYLTRTAKVTDWGHGWKNKTFRSIVQETGRPMIGAGYHVQQSELYQSQGGEGFDYAFGESYTDDRVRLPIEKSALAQAPTANCNDSYKIYSVVTKDTIAGARARHVANSQTISYLNVPQGAGATQTSIEGIFTALETAGVAKLDID